MTRGGKCFLKTTHFLTCYLGENKINMLNKIINTSKNAIYIAEIGLNHNGDFDMAIKMIESAAKSGADAVKFQTFVPELMNSIYTTSLLENNNEKKSSNEQVEFFKQFIFTRDQYWDLFKFAFSLGVVPFSSVFDFPSLEMLEDLNVKMYKIASSDLTNLPLIQEVAQTGKPLILSTGMANLDEITMAVECFRGISNSEIILMHCVSLYPLKIDYANLNRIQSLKEIFNLDIGLSDHSGGIILPVIAASLGSRIFEKHFTVDRNYLCPDKDVSITPVEFSEMIISVENSIKALGDGDFIITDTEAEVARSAKKSLYAKKAIPLGKVLDKDDLVALRPGIGIPVYKIENIIGKEALIEIKKDHLIREEYLK